MILRLPSLVAGVLLAGVLAASLGCSRPDASSSSPAAASATGVASGAKGAASAVVAAPPVDAGPVDTSFEGTYAAAIGSLTPSPDAPKWSGEDAGDGLGPGTLGFRIDGATGRVHGKSDGALGPAMINGQLGDGGVVTFTLLRADPSDGGFTGIGYGVRSGSTFTGTIHASTARGNVLREATFSVTTTTGTTPPNTAAPASAK